jgi:AcrR family transcriptional regulator
VVAGTTGDRPTRKDGPADRQLITEAGQQMHQGNQDTGEAPARRRVSARREEVLSTIVATATEMFAARGYHATGVAELGRAVGLGAGAFYHYIGSKEELLFTIVKGHLERVIEFGRELLERDISGVEKLYELGREHMRLVAYRRLELQVMLREIDSLTGQRREDMLAMRQAVEDIWTEVVRQAQQAGELRVVDPFFVKVALGALNYSVLWFRADGSATPEEMGDRIIRMLLTGQGEQTSEHREN